MSAFLSKMAHNLFIAVVSQETCISGLFGTKNGAELG